jgi:hypothetical protein
LSRQLGLKVFDGDPDPHPDKLSRSVLEMGGPVAYDDVIAAEHGLEYGAATYGNLWRSLSEKGRTVDLYPEPLVMLLAERLAEPTTRNNRERYPYQLIGRRRMTS